MATREEFDAFVADVKKQFDMNSIEIHETIIGLLPPNLRRDIVRLVFLEETGDICVSFQIETVPTDVLQIWGVCKHFHPEVHLLEIYYQGETGTTVHGIDAQILCDHERENRYLKMLEARTKAQQEEDFQLKQMEKSGKVTFH